MPNGIGNSVDIASIKVGQNVDAAQADLMFAYTVREGDDAGLAQLMDKLQVKGPLKDVSLKGLQLMAEQRYQHSGRIYTMFSELLNKIDQMKQRLIQKFGQS
jgi:hypothetical protein